VPENCSQSQSRYKVFKKTSKHAPSTYTLLLLQPKEEESMEDSKDDIKEHVMEEEEEKRKPVAEVVPEVEAAKSPEAAEQRVEMEAEEEEGEPKYIPRLLDGAGKGIPMTIFCSFTQLEIGAGTCTIFSVF
jgi:hypothetical protein